MVKQRRASRTDAGAQARRAPPGSSVGLYVGADGRCRREADDREHDCDQGIVNGRLAGFVADELGKNLHRRPAQQWGSLSRSICRDRLKSRLKPVPSSAWQTASDKNKTPDPFQVGGLISASDADVITGWSRCC